MSSGSKLARLYYKAFAEANTAGDFFAGDRFMIPAPPPQYAYAAVVALDWANRQHAWAMSTSASSRSQTGWLDNTPEAIGQWAAGLAQSYPGASIAFVLEQSRGPVAAQLAKYAHLVLCPVHPSSLALYRKTFRPSGAKDDPTDATALLDLFFHHPELCSPLKPDTVETRTLQFLVEDRRKLVDEQSRLINRNKRGQEHNAPFQNAEIRGATTRCRECRDDGTQLSDRDVQKTSFDSRSLVAGLPRQKGYCVPVYGLRLGGGVQCAAQHKDRRSS